MLGVLFSKITGNYLSIAKGKNIEAKGFNLVTQISKN